MVGSEDSNRIIMCERREIVSLEHRKRGSYLIFKPVKAVRGVAVDFVTTVSERGSPYF